MRAGNVPVGGRSHDDVEVDSISLVWNGIDKELFSFLLLFLLLSPNPSLLFMILYSLRILAASPSSQKPQLHARLAGSGLAND
jgi:hypothetical protein